MRVVVKTLLLSCFFAASSQISAQNFPANLEIPMPIVWGECVPVPVSPMSMPQGNLQMGNNIPFPQPMTFPAPMYGIPNNSQFRHAPHNPFNNEIPSPVVVEPQVQQNCTEYENELHALQKRYLDEASVSRNKIAELRLALEDAQNQITDSRMMVDDVTTKASTQKDRITELENLLKAGEENRITLHNKLDSMQDAASLKSIQESESITLLKKKMSGLESTNITLKNQLSSAKMNIVSQANKLDSLQQSTSEFTAIKSAFKELSTENAELKDQISKFDSANKVLQAQIEKANNDASMQQNTLTALDQSASELSALKKAYNERNDVSIALKNKLKELQKEKANLLASLESKQTASSLKNTQTSEIIAGLKKKLSDSENNNTSLKNQLDTAINNAGTQAIKISALSQNTTELASISSAYKERIDENTGLKKRIYDCDNASKVLNNQLKVATSTVNEQTKKLASLNKSVAELTTLKSAHKKREDEDAALKIKLNDIHDMQVKLDTSKAKMIELQNKLNELEDQRKTLIGKLSTLKETSSNQARKITALMITTSELDALKSAYKDLSSIESKLNNQLGDATADIDNDGILDRIDKCPASPEGTKVNSQGCHDILDADRDGVADTNDLCPTSAAGTVVNGFGCATKESITLKGVNFATGSARLTSDSLPTINAAADSLKQSPELNIEIAGYTDNQGLAHVNKRLSQHRANSVMIQLIKQGVEAERLTSNGYGEKDPVTTNETEEGRATNRRVELKIRE